MRTKALYAALALALAAGTARAAVTEFVIYKQPNFRGASHTVKGEVNNLEGGFANAASSLIVRGGNWEVCTEHHFRGNCYVLAPGEYPSLGRELDRNIVAVRFVANRKVATIDSRDLREDRRDRRDERREERRDRREDQRGWRDRGAVDLYGRQDFRGRSIRIEGSERNLASQGFDGRASSVVVHEGTWEMCTEPGYGGRCAVFRPGQYRHLAGLDDRIASARQVR